jgi:hypothetical protein
MPRWAERAALALCAFLKDYEAKHGRPFLGVASDLSAEMGWHPLRAAVVLMAGARSDEFIDKHHMVIPYVPRGPGEKEWRVVDGTTAPELRAIRDGENIRLRDMHTGLTRIVAMMAYRAPTFNRRTRSGKHAYNAYVQAQAALASVEQSMNS